MQLVIGNKNYSSWSMRPWVLMRQLGLPFDEKKLSFRLGLGTAFGDAVEALTTARRVPVLLCDDGFAVWDSLAIVEALHDMFPNAGVWPADQQARARARSLCAEMHAGFGALRQHCPMNIEAHLPDAGAQAMANPAGRSDLARIDALWCAALRDSGGPFLFGTRFGGADAFYAPVASRTRSYALPLSPAAQAYADRVLGEPGPAAWMADALQEHEFVAEDEPYRSDPGTRR